MNLREKTSLAQKVSEYSIRFRLLEIFLMVVLCIVALFNIEGVLVSIQPLTVQVKEIALDLTQGEFHFASSYGIVFAILVLFFFRWWFFGFKCALLLFLFLIFNALFLLVVGEYIDVVQILMAVIFTIAITCFFFIRSLFIKSIFPLIFLAYALSTWLLFLGVSNLAWFVLISIFFADTFHLIFGLRHYVSENAKKKKTLEGAIASGVRRTIPVSLFSLILLIVLDITFHFLGIQLIASEKLENSIIIYICYVLWMPFFTAAVLSLCPLENTCEKIREKAK
ncbi:MAG: hypothetical protein LBC85_07750 [Fibromonadaceae bacterium]|jgi:hypothetical protein|nr:hypothetical protein [Fibromonadaceae bacterium]